jgi:hypothetical protein
LLEYGPRRIDLADSGLLRGPYRAALAHLSQLAIGL